VAGAPIRVVHGEDSVLIREGVARIFATAPDIELVGAAEDMESLRALVEELEPDVVVTDIRMPPTNTDEGIRVAVELQKTHPGIGVVVLSQHISTTHATLVFAGGAKARAYALKDRIADPGELIRIVRDIAAGEAYIDVQVLTAVMSSEESTGHTALKALSEREREVLVLLAAGRSNAAIAEQLQVTTRAVERHVGSVFTKLGLADVPDSSRRVQATLIYQQAVGGDDA
jgi:DNA-binding NarL/FixJ family response regulator